MQARQRVHGSCASRNGEAVLVIGAPGSGKSDLVLRLLSRGFMLVADDQVEIENGMVSVPPALAGMLEVRGLGIVRLPYAASARLMLVISLDGQGERLPHPARHPGLDVPLLRLDAAQASAADRVALALDCAAGRVSQAAGAFAA